MTYDAGQSVPWNRLSWEETLPANTDIQVQVACSNSPSGPWTFRGPDSTSASYFTTPAGETLPVGANFTGRYCRYQVTLSSNGLATPSFGNLYLSFGGGGMLASSCRNFTYDPAGNLQTVTTITDSGATVDDRNPAANPINSLNQIKGRVVGGMTWTYSYDLNGNLTGKSNGIATWTYTWSDDNRLNRVQGPGVDVSYTYDVIGRMLSRTQGGVVTTFVWDGWDCIREVTGGVNTVYHIPDGSLHSFSLKGKVYQCHLDALGSVRMITDEAGAVAARWEYGAWGEEVFASVSPALAGFAYRFVGGLGVRTDSVTGLVYMRNRWYNAGLMRFVSRDPIGLMSGANQYAYCFNDPARYVDPSGLKSFWGMAQGAASFAAGFAVGAVIGAVTAAVATAAVAALGGIATLAGGLAITGLVVVGTVLAGNAIRDMVNGWNKMSPNEQLFSVGNIVGGFAGGKLTIKYQRLFIVRIKGKCPQEDTLALGLSEHLFEFVAKHNVKTVWKYNAHWQVTVINSLKDPRIRILFNRKGIDPMQAFKKGPESGMTNWEIHQINEIPESWPRIEWYDQWDGHNPFPFGD